MQELVINISKYAKSVSPNFAIIPQNAIELSFNSLNLTEGIDSDYLSVIDGIGVEALFYDGTFIPPYERLTMLQEFSKRKKVMVSDFINDNSLVNDVINKNSNENFICFPRLNFNYDYKFIPDFIINENSQNIKDISEVTNYLYLINGNNYTSKTDLINAISATNYDLILIDLFFHSSPLTTEDLSKLKVKNNGAKRLVIAYMNIGAAEKYRYYFDQSWEVNNPHWLKKPYKGYNEEFFVKFWSSEWHDIIYGNNNSYVKK